jgi:hypothetical protein
MQLRTWLMNMQDQSLYNLLTYSSIKEGLNISQKLKQQVTSEKREREKEHQSGCIVKRNTFIQVIRKRQENQT